jgi:hypothetical protein
MDILAPGSQLAQVQPANTTDVIVFTATLRTVITSIYVCNSSTATPATFRIYHDDDGTTMSTATALYYNAAAAAQTTVQIKAGEEVDGITVAAGGTIGFGVSLASAITITIYGATQHIR